MPSTTTRPSTLWSSPDGVNGAAGVSSAPSAPYVITPSFPLTLVTWAITVSHAGGHLAGWNLGLPTAIKHYLWRVATLCLLIDLFPWGLVEVISVKPGFNYTLTLLGIWEKKASQRTWLREWAVDGLAIVSAMMYFVSKRSLWRSAYPVCGGCLHQLPGGELVCLLAAFLRDALALQRILSSRR